MQNFNENSEFTPGNDSSNLTEQSAPEIGNEYFHPQNLKRLLVDAGYTSIPNPSTLDHPADNRQRKEYFEKKVSTKDGRTKTDTFELIIPEQEKNWFVMNLRKLFAGKDNQQTEPSSINRSVQDELGVRIIHVEGVLGKDGTIIPKSVTLSADPPNFESTTLIAGDLAKKQVLSEINVHEHWQTPNRILLTSESESAQGAEGTTLDAKLSQDLKDLFSIDIQGKTVAEVLQLLIERVNQRLQPE